ncbi:MAG: lasso peptide biosynthesis B2 protein [Flavobacteriales bacterium]|nr:lasso peptide biosynthesis B2 protein [Flavobacteriales bacterium]
MCFEQALTAAKMLKKRKLSSTIYFGVQKDAEHKTKLKAHAWVRSGEITLTGASGHKKFNVVAYFGQQ